MTVGALLARGSSYWWFVGEPEVTPKSNRRCFVGRSGDLLNMTVVEKVI
jgi:hypothetical protein